MNKFKKRKLAAVLACRNTGSRLYGKPLQNLDIKNNYTILDNIIRCLKKNKQIKEIILAISKGNDNLNYLSYAKKYKLKYVIGDEKDVLKRLIIAAKKIKATDVFRVTTESPFIYFQKINLAWKKHLSANADTTMIKDVVDGVGFAIHTLDSLLISHKNGSSKHRSELCGLYIMENPKKFKIAKILPDKSLSRNDMRLTVDYPEDLVLCRKVFSKFKKDAPLIDVKKIVNFLDKNKAITTTVKKYLDKKFWKYYV